MRYLLDTHVFLWLNNQPAKLSSRVREMLTSGEHEFLLSTATPWEIQIKRQLGKLHLDQPLSTILASHLDDGGLGLLPIELTHIEKLGTLESHHKDPFDRMLIAQALAETISIITVDQAFESYPVEVVW